MSQWERYARTMLHLLDSDELPEALRTRLTRADYFVTRARGMNYGLTSSQVVAMIVEQWDREDRERLARS